MRRQRPGIAKNKLVFLKNMEVFYWTAIGMCSVFWILQDFENREDYLFKSVGSGVREQVSGSGSDGFELIACLLLCPKFLSFKIAMCAKSLQSCLILCNHMDCNPPGSFILGILQENGLPCPLPGDLPHPEIESSSLMSPASAGEFFTTGITRESH